MATPTGARNSPAVPRRTVLGTIGRYVAGAVVVALLVVSGVALRVLIAGGTDQRQPADAIVVLGAAQYNGVPSEVFAARLQHALELYQAGVAGHIVTVGGSQAGDAFSEGEAGKNYLIDQGVPAAAIVAVGEGNDTLVSLRAGAAVILGSGWKSIVLVTDPWHSYRSARMAADLGLQVQISPVTTGPAADSAVAPAYLLRETAGTLYYLLFHGSSGISSPVL